MQYKLVEDFSNASCTSGIRFVGINVHSGSEFLGYTNNNIIIDGGTLCGLPRDKALKYAIHTTLGAATLALNSDKHPEQLKDDVCSPGGTTIEGVRTMEENGVRGAMINAIKATYDKTKKL